MKWNYPGSPPIVSCLAALLLLTACGRETDSADVSAADSTAVVKVAGEVHSAVSRNFGAPTVHKIWQFTIAFMAPDGSKVAKGMPVLKFDTQELQNNILQKSNELNEKEKELQKQEILTREKLAELQLLVEQARADRDRAALKADIPETLLASRDYRENQLILKQAKVALSLRETEVKMETGVLATESRILQREIAYLKTEIEELEKSVADMTINAPDDGVVMHSLDRHGNKMAVGDNVWGGRRVVEFPDLSQLELRLEIPEQDSARISIGQPVSFTMDAVQDQVFHGEITELASVVHTKSINQPAKVFDATVALHDPDPELMRPGMSVTAEIRTGGSDR